MNLETFLPTSLPSWVKTFILVAVLLHACVMLVYIALLCCTPAKPQPRITLQREKGQ